jgi:hypothetical protein
MIQKLKFTKKKSYRRRKSASDKGEFEDGSDKAKELS